MHLRPIQLSDLDLLRGWRNDDRIRMYCRQVGLISERDQEAWFKRQNDDITIKMFVLETDLKSSGSAAGCLNIIPVGVCGLTDIDLVNRRAEFSLYIGPEHHKKGYGKKALKQLFNFGFSELGLHTIWGETFEDNPAAKLFEKMGMNKEGTRYDFYFKNGKFIDAYLYSITADEWGV